MPASNVVVTWGLRTASRFLPNREPRPYVLPARMVPLPPHRIRFPFRRDPGCDACAALLGSQGVSLMLHSCHFGLRTTLCESLVQCRQQFAASPTTDGGTVCGNVSGRPGVSEATPDLRAPGTKVPLPPSIWAFLAKPKNEGFSPHLWTYRSDGLSSPKPDLLGDAGSRLAA